MKLIIVAITYLLVYKASGYGEWIDTNWTSFPYMTRLQIEHSSGTSICGGSIISKSDSNGKGVILTAAHCVYGASNIEAFIGCTYTDCTDYPSPSHYPFDHLIIHPDFDPSLTFSSSPIWRDNDIALIYLQTTITHPNSESILLHSDISVVEDNDEIIVSGYYGSCGSTVGCNGGSDLDTLEYQTTHFMTSHECYDIYGSYVTNDHDFCVRDEEQSDGLTSTCGGDSGSPFVFNNKQLGIVSWQQSYCDPMYPSVATSIPYYYEWIKEECLECSGLGCYVDSVSGVNKGNGFTVNSCRDACYSYNYFGLKHDSECICDDSFEDATQYGISADGNDCYQLYKNPNVNHCDEFSFICPGGSIAYSREENYCKFDRCPDGYIYKGDGITEGMTIETGEGLLSTNRKFSAVLQGDGNFVVYQLDPNSGGIIRYLWASWTQGSSEPRHIVYQGDNNVCMRNDVGTTIWCTMAHTTGVPTGGFVMQGDSNLAVYNGNGVFLWGSVQNGGIYSP
eukprot:515460_1